MGTLFDYIDWRGDISFSEVDVTEVDNLIFSLISYIDFKSIVPASIGAHPQKFLAAAKQYLKQHKGEHNPLGAIVPSEIITLLAKAARSQRFSSVSMVGYVNRISDNEQKQFSALTFLFEDKCFVAFRGTDDTIVGWKENFNMSFLSPVPAQTDAMEYLEEISAAYPDRKLYVGGHSKGGNLAVWAAVKCSPEVNSKIISVYNNDGPGFDEDFINSERYLATRDRIRTLIPQSSVVGMLLEHEENYVVISSTGTGLLQHNALTWKVNGGAFVHLDTVTEGSKQIDTTLKTWLKEMSYERRKEILDSIYEILSSTNAKTLTDLNADKLKLVRAWNNLDAESRNLVRKIVMLILKNTK